MRHLEDARFTKLLMAAVLGLGQSVGVEEDDGAWSYVGLLNLIIPISRHAYGNMGYAGQQAGLTILDPNEQRCVVACVTVLQVAGLEIK